MGGEKQITAVGHLRCGKRGVLDSEFSALGQCLFSFADLSRELADIGLTFPKLSFGLLQLGLYFSRRCLFGGLGLFGFYTGTLSAVMQSLISSACRKCSIRTLIVNPRAPKPSRNSHSAIWTSSFSVWGRSTTEIYVLG